MDGLCLVSEICMCVGCVFDKVIDECMGFKFVWK